MLAGVTREEAGGCSATRRLLFRPKHAASRSTILILNEGISWRSVSRRHDCTPARMQHPQRQRGMQQRSRRRCCRRDDSRALLEPMKHSALQTFSN